MVALVLGGVEQRFSCLITQNCQGVQSMGRSMDWTFEDDMIDRLFFCTILTGRRGDHTSFVQARAEMSDTGAEAFKKNPRCSWKGHSRSLGTGVGDESRESRSVVQPLRIAPPRTPHF